MAINQINEATFDYAMMLSVINLSYKTQADITITNFDDDTAPQVTAGSIFANNGAIFENTTLATPTGYAGISNSTTFYLYLDVEPTPTFIFSNTVPTWSDAKQGWYNGNDRAFFSMYKDSGGTLYQNKGAMQSPTIIPAIGELGAFVTAASTALGVGSYAIGITVAGNTLIVSTETPAPGSALSARDIDDMRVVVASSTNLGYTGTWRLLSSISVGGPTTIPIALFQRIA